MQYFGPILKYFLIAAIVVITAFVLGFIIQFVFIVKYKKKYPYYKNMKFSKYLMFRRFFGPYEFIKWFLIDIWRGKDRLKIFGIWCFTGYYGQGKTLGATTYACELKRKHKNKNINLFSNFNLKGQIRKITKWQDLLELPDNSIVVFDEIQSTFTSAKFKDFPLELLWKITQCRKRNLAIFCSSPVYSRMTIQLRESTDYVIVCKNVWKLDRWFRYCFYHAPDYEKYCDQDLKLRMHREMTYNLIAQDKDYKRYDTYQMVDRLDITGEEEKAEALTKSQKEITLAMRNQIEKIVDAKIKEWQRKTA